MLNVSSVFKISIIAGVIFLGSCGTNKSALNGSAIVNEIQVNKNASGQTINISLEKGESHNYPSFSIWAEDMDENFIQTLFVTKSIGTGFFGHGAIENEKWDNKPGVQKRPASLPYWINKRIPANNGPQLPDPDHPVLDAYTGATPVGSTRISSRLNKSLSGKIRILLEVNQPWDWNEYWTNELYNDVDYRTSCQPSLIYSVTIDLDKPQKEFFLNPIGHGHYSGENGELYTDLSTITTAFEIFRNIKVVIRD